jgi:hypothetical protein
VVGQRDFIVLVWLRLDLRLRLRLDLSLRLRLRLRLDLSLRLRLRIIRQRRAVRRETRLFKVGFHYPTCSLRRHSAWRARSGLNTWD